MNQVACRVPLVDGAAKATGALRFTADLLADPANAGLLHGALIFSPHPHARVLQVETAAALALPGVHAVYWHGNTPANRYNSSIWFAGQQAPADEQMFAATARHIGDRVALVLAETEALARAAAALVVVCYAAMPATLTPEAALAEGAMPAALKTFSHGDTDAAFAGAAVVIEASVSTPRSHHCAIEPHVCLARPEPGGRVLILSPCQSVFAVQAVVACALGLPPERIRVAKTPIGGSFGGKAEPILDPLCAYAALALQRPVLICLNRHETFTATRTRAAMQGRMRVALAADGRILARDTEVLVDVGAYVTGGNYLPGSMLQRLVRLYDVGAERYRGRAVTTNTLPTGAFRGYGSPQIHALAEIALDRAAQQLGMDPLAIRLRNIVAPGAVDPWQGLDLGNARGRDCLVRGAAAFDWPARWRADPGQGRWRRGVGLACATHINGCYPGFEEETTATLRLRSDGRVELICALHDLGCGAETTMAQIAAQMLGLEARAIVIVPTDTDTCPYDLGTRASRLTYICGEAVRRAGAALALAICRTAGLEMNTASDSLRLAAGQVAAAAGGGAALSLADLAARTAARGASLPSATETYRAGANPSSYAAHFAAVEVDTLTGVVRVTDYLAAHDLGRAINPMLVEGQIHGGIQIGLGYALLEDVAIDPASGRVGGASFAHYTLANAPEMPPIRVLLVEEGEPTGPFGAKAVGEIATVPVAPALVNAVNHALATGLGNLPLTPERVLAALQDPPWLARAAG
ncbi:MAG: xanthine dehydrogenase family protein molybdopterin-binding subunit [Pseudorhodobacter sp.]|nr:xanthine dehydrogenase family protein molybdopterin-binding subunit [Pseudorhodobacter sp.]